MINAHKIKKRIKKWGHSKCTKLDACGSKDCDGDLSGNEYFG